MGLSKEQGAQSATEYLITYGWAILIIAVSLTALFALGIFNPSNYAPMAISGGCQVYRPNGPATQQQLALIGLCDSLSPKSVVYFNGKTSSVNFVRAPRFTKAVTVSAWIDTQNPLTNNGVYQQIFNNNQIFCFLTVHLERKTRPSAP